MRKGQSLLETIVAISILTVGFLGIVSLISQSLSLNRVTTDETTATYLAAEGIEVAKNIIDHDMYPHAVGSTGTWGSCFASAGVSVGGPPVDFALDYATFPSSSQPCSIAPQYPPHFNPSQPLQFDPTINRYGYNLPAGVTTTFTRDVAVSMPNQNEIIVSSTVTWPTSPLGAQGVSMVDYFYNWFP